MTHADPGARPRGRRAGLPRPDRPVPARAAGALLPHPRLGAGRRGPGAGDAAGRLARAGRLRGARLAALVAVPDRHQPLPERAARQRPAARRTCSALTARADAPEPTSRGEPIWLQPYPDSLLEGLPDRADGPDVRYETKEAVALAFVSGPAAHAAAPARRAGAARRAGLPRRRGGGDARQHRGVGEQRAAARAGRASSRRRAARDGALPHSPAERELLTRFSEAFERGDIDAVVALLTDDAWIRMPPEPHEYQGRAGDRRVPAHALDLARRPAASGWCPRAPTAARLRATTSATPTPTSPAPAAMLRAGRWRATGSPRSRASATPACCRTSGCRAPCRCRYGNPVRQIRQSSGCAGPPGARTVGHAINRPP